MRADTGRLCRYRPARVLSLPGSSDHGAEQDEQETIDVMRDLARSLRD
ncbi:hypothetical protein [Streptomyces turgidiscabies]|uniref:Uncharacterized protein n=1 Tax=Streptomyces turgidiscabies TaxID=85558 RepID=A0ABU0RRY9_9ACTN|nr:hypothetical protein [Streptomyces turgidiscabies]MDQ0934759.1 hypothetical protein [Streptomyces turgidiscabies]